MTQEPGIYTQGLSRSLVSLPSAGRDDLRSEREWSQTIYSPAFFQVSHPRLALSLNAGHYPSQGEVLYMAKYVFTYIFSPLHVHTYILDLNTF